MSGRGGYCGLDFGTSNSTVGITAGNGFALCRLEGDNVTLPSAVFFDYEAHKVRYGREGIASISRAARGACCDR